VEIVGNFKYASLGYLGGGRPYMHCLYYFNNLFGAFLKQCLFFASVIKGDG